MWRSFGRKKGVSIGRKAFENAPHELLVWTQYNYEALLKTIKGLMLNVCTSLGVLNIGNFDQVEMAGGSVNSLGR